MTLSEKSTSVPPLVRTLAVPVLIFAIVFLGYYLSNRQPLDWYKHEVYLTQAILHGTLDVGAVGIPDFYQDILTVDGHKYVGFGPGPTVLLMPFVAIWGTHFSQAYFSMALGAINAVLFWYLLGLLNISRTTKLLLVPFFAFGTAHFYAATTGTSWFYGHVASVFFLLLAIITLLRNASLIVPGALLGLSFLSREESILAAPFFLYWIWRQRHTSIFNKQALQDRHSLVQMAMFGAALVPFVGIFLWYNFVRFDSPFETGYDTLYHGYVNSGIPYTFYLKQFPDGPHFGQFDIRNVPVSLFTMLLLPPEYVPDWSVFRPSPYGMSVLLTSPPFIYAAFVKRRDILIPACWLAIAAILIPILFHYSQGWVQFGYRLLLNFAPFLLILTAFGFDDNQSPGQTRLKVLLVAFSILVGFWGRYWGNQLGW